MTKDEIRAKAEEIIKQYKETDCGRYGKAFELSVKMYMNGRRGNITEVARKGKVDMYYKGQKFEIKSNCGEINDDIFRNKFVVYSPDNEIDYLRPWNARILTPEQFVAEVKNCGLYRRRKSTGGYVKNAIQSYKNSRKKFTLWTETLKQFEKLEDFKNRV